MIRTLRIAIEGNIGEKIELSDPIVPWIVRHASYLINRCVVREDSKTAMRNLKCRKVNTPLMPLAEVVEFKHPKAKDMPGDFADKFQAGVWLGVTVRSGEHLVATSSGMYKVETVMRRGDDGKWPK